VSIYRDGAANAIKSGSSVQSGSSNTEGPTRLNTKILAASTIAQTVKVRAGGTAGTCTLNGHPGSLYGGVHNSFIEIQEMMA